MNNDYLFHECHVNKSASWLNTKGCCSTPVPCVYDLDFIFKAMTAKTKITIQGREGTIEGVERVYGQSGKDQYTLKLDCVGSSGWVHIGITAR